MKGDRVTIKRATIHKLIALLEDKKIDDALDLLDRARNPVYNAQLQVCKDVAYQRFRKGEFDYDTYRRLWNAADIAQV